MVYAESMIVFPLTTHAAFCALQSCPHEIWARFFGSSMKDDLRYTPSDCFETFPFPEHWQTHPALEAAGEAYYDFRVALMVENDEGLTKTYNRHPPNNGKPGVNLRGYDDLMAKQGNTRDRPNPRHCPSIKLVSLTGRRSFGSHQGQRLSNRTVRPDT